MVEFTKLHTVGYSRDASDILKGDLNEKGQDLSERYVWW